MRLKALATLLFAFAFALVAGSGGGASAQRRRAPRPGANDNTAQASQNDNRPKHVFISHGSDTARGSRMTVTSDNPLNDYRAYQSGDRFYVELPNANADAAARAAGRGFSDMQVQRRGKSVVLSYRIQPGAKPHVEQRFNRLDVVFDAPEGAQASQGNSAAANNAANSAASAAQNRNPAAAEQPAGQNPPAQQNPNNAAAERRAAAQAESAGQTQAAGVGQAQGANAGQAQASNAAQPGLVAPPASAAGEQPSGVEQSAANTTPPTAEQTPAGVPSPAPNADQQLAQSQTPSTIAPITADANKGAQSGASLGTFLLRNWELSLIVALALALFGLIFVTRRASGASPAALEESGAATTLALEEARVPRLKSAPADASLRKADARPAALREAGAGHAELRGTDASGKASKIAPTDALPLVASSALAAGAAVEEKKETKASVEGEKKSKKGKRQADRQAAAESTTAVAEPTAAAEPVTAAAEPSAAAEESTLVAEPSTHVAESAATAGEASTKDVEPSVVADSAAEPAVAESAFGGAVAEQPSAEEAVAESAAGPSVAESTAIEAASFVAPGVAEAALRSEPEASAGVAAGPSADAAAASSKGIAPAAEPPDHTRVEAETRRLLEGEAYDRAVVGTTDNLARQLVAAELLSALAGRNAERRERARAAFAEHGFFEETARDLHMAEAPAERAAAARSLAITGDRAATPHLVAALEDESADVRRASAEALGALRDPAAVKPLEQLLESEKGWRNRVPSRVIRHALDTCREAAAEERAALHARPAHEAAQGVEVAPAVETAEVLPAAEATSEVEAVESAPEVKAVAPASEVEAAEITPTVEAAVPSEAAHAFEIEPAHEARVVASAVDETRVVALAPVAEEAAEHEEVAARREATGKEIAPAEVTAKEEKEEIAATEKVTATEEVTAVTVFEAATSAEEFESAEAARPFVGQAAAEQPAVEQPLAVEVYEPSAAHARVEQEEEVEHAGVAESAAIEPRAEEASEAARGESSVEISPVNAGEWFDFDLSGAEHETQPAAHHEPPPGFERAGQPSAERPASFAERRASLFESSSGEALTTEAAGHEAAPAAEDVRSVEHFAGEAAEAEAARGLFEQRVTPRGAESADSAPAAQTSEKGVAPFDEFSTVPASIQQRLASREPAERAAAIVELSHVDTDEAFQQICAAFDDDAKEVRSAAARALYDLREDRAESFTRALREAAPERRRHIGAAIASSGLAADAISQLTGESREKTYEAFSLLFLMAKAGEVQPLVRAIEGHANSEVRLAVVKLLALSGQKEILPAFRRLAVRGSLPTEVRSAVMEAIYQISSSQPSAA